MRAEVSSGDDDQFRHPWLGVEVRHLAALVAIARERSFSGAADELGYVQSTVSQQIARLEDVVGARLVERARGRRAVHLTPAGGLLAHHARTLLEVLQGARIDLAAVSGASTAVLRVGVAEAIAPRLLAPLLSQLGERMPLMRLEVVEPGDDDRLPVLIEQGELDIALGPAPADREPFEVRRLLKDPYVLVVPAELRPTAGRIPPASDLSRYRLYAPPPSRDLLRVEAQLEGHGLPIGSATRVPVTDALHAIVAAGSGMALMPRLAAEPSRPGTRTVDLDGLALPRVISLYWYRRRQTLQLLEDFTEVVVDTVVKLEQDPMTLVA